MNLIEDLRWRGLVAQSTDEAALLESLKKPTTLYVGFDPTAPSLHAGNLVVLLVLRRFQLAGHNPIALVGGATGLVGDPSGKNEERTLNSTEIVEAWVSRIRKQVSAFLDFDAPKNPAQVVNNLDWTSPLSAIEFLRDIGKHFSVNQMLAKDSVRLSSLRAIKSAFLVAQTEKGAGELDDAAKQKIIQKQVKQRKDAAAIYLEQNRQDLADDELAQVSILEEFLPEQLSEDEIRETVSAVVSQMGAKSMADMGKVMGAANKQLAGRADGKLIAHIVKSILS